MGSNLKIGELRKSSTQNYTSDKKNIMLIYMPKQSCFFRWKPTCLMDVSSLAHFGQKPHGILNKDQFWTREKSETK